MSATRNKHTDRDQPKRLTLLDKPFRRLVEEVTDLRDLRTKYRAAPPDKQRKAALFEYERSCAEQMFADAVSRLPGGCDWPVPDEAEPCPGAVLALAIDPECAPALLTVGSAEYQLGRKDEAMQLFLALPALAPDTKDLPTIIDEAGDFLIQQDDMDSAISLYTAAIDRHPAVAVYHSALGYCVGKLGRHEQAVAHSRRAVELEPENHIFLNDLGYSLVQAGAYDDAEQVLLKAVELAGDDDNLPRNNLDDLRRSRKQER